MQGLASVIVLYQPDLPEVFTHMQSYAKAISHFYVVDNSNADHSETLQQYASLLNVPVNYMPNGANRGIAAALNQGCVSAIRDGYEWCLLMDQDSFFRESDLQRYISYFHQHIHDDKRVGILSVLHGNLIPVQKDAIAENMHSITSGSIIRLSVFQQTGGHDEFLFIDEVDADYSYRLAVLGFKTIRFNGATLQHRLGVLQEARLAGLIKMGKRSFHAPWRNYYMIRNYIIVRHRYKKKLPEIYRKRDRDTLVSVKNNLLLSGRFFPVLYHLIRGFFDGMKYRHKLPVSQLSSSV